jgi:catechol 2,3-dioxygenase-like lactoylglutathione lyase family enzyme
MSTLRLEGLSLTVTDVARSVEFYTNIGFEIVYQTKPVFALIRMGGAGGSTIGLLSISEAQKEGVIQPSTAQARATHVELTTDDLDDLYQVLMSRGVIFSEPPHDEPWERAMTAFDPDGYAVEFAQGKRGQNSTVSQAATAISSFTEQVM